MAGKFHFRDDARAHFQKRNVAYTGGLLLPLCFNARGSLKLTHSHREQGNRCLQARAVVSSCGAALIGV
jgi:hypothetical protein